MTHPPLIAAMLRSAFYTHRPAEVQLVQTHISWILIAGDEVYKVKKAMDFGFLDFTTLEKRRFYCAEELRLNRRLAPDVYLEVAEIRETGEGRFSLDAPGRVIEYAVHMKRLPQDRMLKALLAKGEVGPEIFDALARKLADFHGRAETGGTVDALGSIDTIRHNHEENFAQVARFVPETLSVETLTFIQSYSRRFLAAHADLLNRRVAEHRIRECHGDLHLEHICIADTITIFDCIEFNERFRCEDVAAEVAFLAMDLDYNGYESHAERFVEAYERYTGDSDLRRLLSFYKCYYAFVRAKVTSFRLDDRAGGPEERSQIARMAQRYFDLALRYACRLEKPTLIVTVGLMGSGKSALARDLASLLDIPVIRSDQVRKDMLQITPTARHPETFGAGIYREEITRQTYEKAFARAAAELRRGRSVLIDASFKKQADRIRAGEVARDAGAGLVLIECRCPDAEIRKRLEERQKDTSEVSDGRWDLFNAQKADFDPVTAPPGATHLVIDTDQELAGCIRQAAEELIRTGWEI